MSYPNRRVQKLLTFTVLLIAILALFPLYSRFKRTTAPVPPGVYLGGLNLSDLKNSADIRQHLERLYQEPIAVDFAEQRLVLRPGDIDFYLDVEGMVEEAGQYLAGAPMLDIAVREALGFAQTRRDVPVRFTLNVEKLRTWLVEVAAQHNRNPVRPRTVASEQSRPNNAVPADNLSNGAWRWVPGAPGYTLDIEKSIPPIIAALTHHQNRVAKLALIETPPVLPHLDDLQPVLDSYLDRFPGFAAVYVLDLQSGAEISVDADVAFSGGFMLKLALALAAMKELHNGLGVDNPTHAAIGQRIDLALSESDNAAANALLRDLGGGAQANGAQKLTDFVRSLGLVNTYLQAGFDELPLPPLPTPANQQTEWNTNPNANLQTTPADMGRILGAIFECSGGSGLLLQLAAQPITPEECRHILFYMTHIPAQDLIWGGLPRPQERWIVHQQGLADETHADVALVWGPSGPYVISIFLYQGGWLPWETSNATMQAVSRFTWDFFAFQAEQGVKPAPPPPTLNPPPGYVALGDYESTPANPAGQ